MENRKKSSSKTAVEIAPPPEKERPKRRTRVAKRTKSSDMRLAKYSVGDVVRHRFHPFRGVVFDIDPVFSNSEEWWLSIPAEMRPVKDQPFYHLLAENDETEYVAYVSEQNLLPDTSGTPLRHPKVTELFSESDDGKLMARYLQRH